VGQEVLLVRTAMPSDKPAENAAKSVSRKRLVKRGIFDKTSLIGSYILKPKFQILLAKLRTTRDDEFIPGRTSSPQSDPIQT